MEKEVLFQGEGIKVLVVDDNEVNTMVVASMLEQFHISVKEVYSGKEAVELERTEEYDIIFMDYLMPEMNGIEATEEIRKLGKIKRPIIVALTANETHELKNKFQQAGVDDVLVKPLELDAVCEIMRKWFPEKEIGNHKIESIGSKPSQLLMEAFSKIQELDVKKGLSHLANSAENYVKVIKAAVDNMNVERKRLNTFNESQIQVTSMKNSFHSLKGVFLNLGVSRLANQSQLFELACGNNEVDFVKKSLDTYLLDLQTFTMQLEEALLEYDETYTKNKEQRYMPLEREEFSECLEALKYYLARYEFNYLPELIEKLVYATQGKERETMNEVARKIHHFQYEEALSLLEKPL